MVIPLTAVPEVSPNSQRLTSPALLCAWTFGLILLMADPSSAAPTDTLAARIAAEQIVVLQKPPQKPQRTRAETLERAREAHRRVLSGSLPFDAAVLEYSDAPEATTRGGYIGIFDRTALTGEGLQFVEALFSLEVGQVSPLLETTAGFTFMRRVPIREWSGAHLLVQYSGARNAPVELRRTRAEAEALVRRLLAQAREKDSNFPALVRRHSEAPDRASGGSLGIFGPFELLPALEQAIARLDVGAVGGPVESPLGFHIVRRTVIERCHIAHILIRFQGASFDEGVSRTKEEARRRARTLCERARRPGADFAQLAREFSEDGTGASGGALQPFGRGEMDPAFEQAAFELKVGAVSDPVASPHGFHVLLRLPGR